MSGDLQEKGLVYFEELDDYEDLSPEARNQIYEQLRKLQQGETIKPPFSRPMKTIGVRCHELRINDAGNQWRIFYHIADRDIVVLGILKKKSQKTPKRVISTCRKRLRRYYDSL